MTEGPDPEPIVERVDALLRRHQHAGPGEPDLPVLTDVIEDPLPGRPAAEPAAIEALAREIERAVLARLGPELERVLAELVRKAVADALARRKQER
jgi:hypothetical protein